MAKNQLPKIEELFSDPKHSELADWFKGMYKFLRAEEIKERDKRKTGKEQTGLQAFLGGLLGNDDSDDNEDNHED